MDNNEYSYKSFDCTNTKKKDKLRNEYFNPYGYNIYSSLRENQSSERDFTHTNQDYRCK
ncbi:MAG: hypothetical protein R3Y13_04495 [bacterium]